MSENTITENDPATTTLTSSSDENQSQSQAMKPSQLSFSIWPPTQRTRDAVTSRLIENLSTPSLLSKRYGTMPPDEAADAAKRIEAQAFNAAPEKLNTDGDSDGMEVLHSYSKEISKLMLETIKARSERPAPAADNAGETAAAGVQETDA